MHSLSLKKKIEMRRRQAGLRCGSCQTAGRVAPFLPRQNHRPPSHIQCLCGSTSVPRKPRTEAHFDSEALRKRVNSLQAYVDVLEAMLAKYGCMDISFNLQLRPQQHGEQSEMVAEDEIKQSLTLLCSLSRQVLDEDLGSLALGIFTEWDRFGPPREVSRIVEPDLDLNMSYVFWSTA
ncbi:hypothetical protein C8F04DRAFT_1159729 [Mycena alexandri]|uniref:Uncharacterized protein n=1 Tax=Mycena alexandri TaxID=1745969 RepID=A0AAD6RWM5_9AGAR|nr:hypothetical protein C8F04DRAFT_1159729 [Mycena alexandri]